MRTKRGKIKSKKMEFNLPAAIKENITNVFLNILTITND